LFFSRFFRPEFLDHFDKKDVAAERVAKAEPEEPPPPATAPPAVELNPEEEEGDEAAAATAPSPSLQRQLHQIAGGQNLSAGMGGHHQPLMNPLSSDMSKFQRSINEGDFEFLKYLTFDDLTLRMSGEFGTPPLLLFATAPFPGTDRIWVYLFGARIRIEENEPKEPLKAKFLRFLSIQNRIYFRIHNILLTINIPSFHLISSQAPNFVIDS
jgi:hypothetical protein